MEKKCINCRICNGKGCIGQMPGMGGVFQSQNFISNCTAWERLYAELNSKGISLPEYDISKIAAAPMTGAIENIGYPEEEKFYLDLVEQCQKAGIYVSIGDGTPDEKLLGGIKAMEKFNSKGAVFLKPYSNEKLFQRIDWAKDCAQVIGIDIDAYNIVTMRNKANLEKKSALQLLEIQNHLHSLGIEFAIKGVFTKEDLELVKEVKPDIAFVSNHGGRVETDRGSSADFLAANNDFLKDNSGTVWVDGGIRTKNHVQTALFYGADKVLIGRPLATALLYNKDLSQIL